MLTIWDKNYLSLRRQFKHEIHNSIRDRSQAKSDFENQSYVSNLQNLLLDNRK